MNGPAIRIIIAEDKVLLRKSFMALLKEYPAFEVAGEAGNGRELLDMLKKMKADVVLLDIEMPLMNGIEALKVIQLRFPGIKVIMLSIHSGLSYIKACIALGAKGYLTKNCSPEQLSETIINVHQKGFYLEPQISMELLINPAADLSGGLASQSLSSRELEVLKALYVGLTEKEIAQKLSISQHTVHFHKRNIYTKTNTHNIAGLLKYGGENDIL